MERVYDPIMIASHARCMDVQRRMHLHGLLPLEDSEDVGGVMRRVPVRVYYFVMKKMAGFVDVEWERKKKIDIQIRCRRPRRRL